jgi:hypothetical protein
MHINRYNKQRRIEQMMTENQVTVLACLFTDNPFFSVTNVLIVLLGYFGDKLGVGGLIAAYKTTAQMVLKPAKLSKNDRYSFYNHF